MTTTHAARQTHSVGFGCARYNAALLAPIVQSSRTLGEVIRRLGLPTTGGNYRHISARIRLAGLDTSHFRSITIEKRCAAIPAETLAALAATSTSIAQVLIKLDMQPAGRAHRLLSRRILKLGIDTSHFRGQGWARGETVSTIHRWQQDVCAEHSAMRICSSRTGRPSEVRGW